MAKKLQRNEEYNYLLNGETLYVNADARDGELRAEVLNAAEDVVAVSRPVTDDATRTALQWETGELEPLKNQPVKLRFTPRNAHLYAYWLE